MRHDAICSYLDAQADLHKAQALLDDLEPSSGGRAALESKVAELELAAINLAVQEDAEAECGEPMPPPHQTSHWNGRGVFWGALFSLSAWYGIYRVTWAFMRWFA